MPVLWRHDRPLRDPRQRGSTALHVVLRPSHGDLGPLGCLPGPSLCCDMPQELIDNYEVLRNLPEHLQQVAIKAKKAEYAAMAKKSAENARRFREAVEHWNAKHGHLTKDAQDGIPFDHEGATSPKLQNLPKET